MAKCKALTGSAVKWLTTESEGWQRSRMQHL